MWNQRYLPSKTEVFTFLGGGGGGLGGNRWQCDCSLPLNVICVTSCFIYLNIKKHLLNSMVSAQGNWLQWLVIRQVNHFFNCKKKKQLAFYFVCFTSLDLYTNDCLPYNKDLIQIKNQTCSFEHQLSFSFLFM